MIPSLSDNKKRIAKQRKRVYLISFTVFFVLTWVFFKPALLVVLDPISAVYFKTASALYTVKEKTSTYFSTKERLKDYVTELEDENSRLHNRLALYENDGCHVENVGSESSLTGTTTTLGVCPTLLLQTKERGVATKASPLLSTVSYLFDTVRLNKGAKDGVFEGDIVYARGRVALGKVLSTTPTTSLVLLFSKDGIETYGSLREKGTTFKVFGNGGGSYVALVPREVEVKVGDNVLLTEDQDFSIGTVASVAFLKQDVSKKVFIRGAFHPSKLSAFYITTHDEKK